MPAKKKKSKRPTPKRRASKKRKSVRPPGRPQLPFNRKKFEEACKVQSTLNEIAAELGVDPKTVETRVKEFYGVRFVDVVKRLRQVGFVSLRRRQYQVAMKGNVPMLKFLGQNWLRQRQRFEAVGPEEARRLLAEQLGVNPDDLPPTDTASP